MVLKSVTMRPLLMVVPGPRASDMELQCKVQNYEWGKRGLNSTVAKLIASADANSVIESNKPYAELWMGTHPNGPSLIIERDVLLSEYIKDNQDAIGPVVKKKFGIQVPFLLKVLSIEKALSIQAHPNKEHAEQLHQSFPERYTDPNHKPELSIALTPFEALCGFRLLPQIQTFLSKLPELTQILPQDAVDAILAHEEQGNSDKVLKQVIKALMLCDKTAIANSLKNLLARLENEDLETQSALLYPLVRRLHQDYPGDVGCWAPYFMNYMQLRPGQAIFLKSNLPHAYISGDCVECMACSDNVVRAGLTPKPIDIETLIEMLDYSSYAQEQLLFNPHMEDANSCIWRPPVADFAVVKIRVESDGEPYNTIIRPSPSLIIITSGSGEVCDTLPITAKPGVVVFLKASRQLTLTPANRDHIEAYQAICNV
ncbi:mannose-6-phosphate isomerase isoform X2 [Galleria mellonella]|uniref:Mannose-6-phosphate isomerase n=1 Tax=Galleria mellonella TaxID=7137 RepID=A0A6J3CAE1_GALME|nr:mannose-6-phosphate isomerase isoform X2 [Galleria mellonella]